MTANTGTPSSIPLNPQSPPNMVMANMTQNPERPVFCPRISGPITFPSNCCNITIRIIKYRHCLGSTKSTRNALGLREKLSGWGGVGYWASADATKWTDLNARIETDMESKFTVIAG